MKLEEFRRRHRPRAVRAANLTWRVIQTRGRGKDAPVLVLLPGTLGTAEIFWNQIAALGKRVRIVSVTYPEIGDIKRLADGLAALLDRLGIETASFAGSSLGGFLGQWFAARHPERVERLFIGNSLIDPKKVNPARMKPAALRRLPGKVHRGIVLGSVETWPEPEPIFATLKDILRGSGTRLISARALKARVLAVATSGAVPPLSLPASRIVIIDSDDDPLIPASARRAMRRRYKGAKSHRFKIGGHYPYITRPRQYTEVLRRYVLG
jgi:pimeloyl-ACP methyl ester carboxylesterase